MDISSEFINTWEAVSYAELNSMTNDDAITYLKSIDSKYIHGGDSAFDSRRHVAIAKAIVALRDQKPKEDTKCSDYIIETDATEPKTKVIKNWYDLDGLENDNYRIEVDHNMLCGWVVDKTEGHHKCYLSTHTFYEMNYKGSTKILNDLGFDVVLESWG